MESIKFVLKKVRNLPISSLVMEIFTAINTSSTEEDVQTKPNTHEVLIFDKRSIRFSVEKTKNLAKVQATRKFKMGLDKLWHDCGEFQNSFAMFSCSFSCKHAHQKFGMYITLVYTLE